MQPVTRADIPSLEGYLAHRDDIRRSMIALRNRRRVALGELVSLAFENRETVAYQICEMMRIEHITDPVKLGEEILTYNDLIPKERELSATVFIEVPDPSQVRGVLNRLVGVDEHLTLYVDGIAVVGESEPGRSTEEKTASVHYVKFALPEEARDRLGAAARGGRDVVVELASDHPRYRRQTVLTAEQVAELARDVVGDTL